MLIECENTISLSLKGYEIEKWHSDKNAEFRFDYNIG